MKKTSRESRSGFTLIELLVVVAIIALLISILLPSLSKARSQARATLCASRLSQMTKAMILYASDNEETPPFVGIGFRRLGEDHTTPVLQTSEFAMAPFENWLIDPLFPGNDPTNLTIVTGEWDTLVPTPKVETGKLFPYTRFANLYRCPEFERTPTGSGGFNNCRKMQNTFNYTRSIAGRKLLSNMTVEGPGTPLPDPGADQPLTPGPIMKLGAVHAPAGLMMMIDEQWDYHCAGNYRTRSGPDDGSFIDMNYAWMAADPIHGIVFDCIGSYHGNKSRLLSNYPFIYENQKGNLGFYDGHVEIYQDPWPYRAIQGGISLDLIGTLLNDLQTGGQGSKILDPILMSIYAQRGFGLSMEQIVALIQGLGG